MDAETMLWYEKPAEDFDHALPVGNGRIGAMIFGGAADEVLKLNEDSIWSGGKRNRNNPDARAPALDLPHDGGSLGVEQLHADFQKGFALLVLKEVEEPEGVFRRLEVAGYDYIVLHNIQI